MGPRTTVVCLVIVASLASAVPAVATTRYVTPDGTAGGDCTLPPPTNPPTFFVPCDFEYAIESVSVDGDDVIVAPGDYSVTDSAIEQHNVTIHGEAGQPRPRIVFANPSHQLSLTNQVGGTVRHLEVSGGVGLGDAGKLGEDLLVRGSVNLSDGFTLGGNRVLRDTIIASPGGFAIQAGTGVHELRNVTAVATGNASSGIRTFGGGLNCPAIRAKNIIARGTANDLAGPAGSCSAAPFIEISHSNYRADQTTGEIDDGGGNQTNVDPVFADAAAGDYHQLPTSPTIDAGTADALLGAQDFDGEARTIGPAPDIGADESPVRDRDGDGVFEPADNCASTLNPDQADLEGDGQGDPCDPDDDNDGVADELDRCPADPSADRRDTDGDGQDNPCDADDDNDGVADPLDAFPLDPARSVAALADGATDGDDVLNGTPGPDLICGLLGDDTINGLAGNDTLWGDACGALSGPGGADTLRGGAGNDRLFGGGGRDKLAGGKGRNSLSGGGGNDSIGARNGKRDAVDCGAGKKDVATVDRRDRVRRCERVRRP